MLKCKEVARKIASDEFAEAAWTERLAVRLHLFMCRHCRRYAVQLRAVGVAAKGLWDPRSQHSPALERLERQILNRSLGTSESSTENSNDTGKKADPR